MYYFLYRVFNNYYLSRNYRDTHMDKYLHDLLLRVLEDIEYTSDNEKIAMHNLVSNWTSVNRNNSLKVYGKPTVHKFDNDAEVSMHLYELLSYWYSVVVMKFYPSDFSKYLYTFS